MNKKNNDKNKIIEKSISKANTLIQVKVETALALNKIKKYERESYNDVIQRLLQKRKN
jgi:predicted nucleic-acid-binding protein